MLIFLFVVWWLLIISNFLVITIYAKKYKKVPYIYQMIAYSVEGIVCVLCAMFLESDISIGFVLAAAVISFIMAVYSIFAKRHYEITMKQLQEVDELYNQMVGKN